MTQPERVRFSYLCCEKPLIGPQIAKRPNSCVGIPMYFGTSPRIAMRLLEDGPDAMHKNSSSPLNHRPIPTVSAQKTPQPTLRQCRTAGGRRDRRLSRPRQSNRPGSTTADRQQLTAAVEWKSSHHQHRLHAAAIADHNALNSDPPGTTFAGTGLSPAGTANLARHTWTKTAFKRGRSATTATNEVPVHRRL